MAVAVVTATATSGGSMDWGDVPVPEACVMNRMYLADDQCSLGVDCVGVPTFSECSVDGDGATCVCGGSNQQGAYDLFGVNLENACAYALAACLHAPPFEAGAYECVPRYDQSGMDSCTFEGDCTRGGVIGEIALIERTYRGTQCSAGTTGWDCSCFGPDYETWFEVPNATSMTLCVDAGNWCRGDELEVVGNRECSPNEASVTPDFCSTRLECEQAVFASGMEATMHQSVPLQCWLGADGIFECSCLPLGNFSVDAPDSERACNTAADICAGS